MVNALSRNFEPVSIPEPMSLVAFLAWEQETECCYELIEGEPVPIFDPTADHEDVADALCEVLRSHCVEQNLPYVPKRSKLISLGLQKGRESARRADIVMFDRLVWEGMKGSPRSAMAYDVPPLVIEVVSTNWRDDYLTKLAEYEARGVQNYWVVDYAALGGMRYIGRPKRSTLSIYQMPDGETEYGAPLQFHGEDEIVSRLFPKLRVTAAQIFQG
jgi:Uma2 family endonuclease